MTGKKTPWYFRAWVVIVMLFLVLGPLGLPLVYKSPEFSRRAKIVLTAAMVVFTFFMLWESWRIIKIVVEEMNRLSAV